MTLPSGGGAHTRIRHLVGRAVVVIVGLSLLSVLGRGLIESLDWAIYDRALRWQSLNRAAEVTPYVLVEVDDASIEVLGRFPWGRAPFAALLERTTRGRAAVVGVDVLFSEPADSEGDAAFADAVRAAGNVVLASAAAMSPPGVPPSVPVQGALARLRGTERLLEPLPRLAAAAGGVGSISVEVDDDGVLRRYPFVIRYLDRPYPSLAQAMAAITAEEGVTDVPLRSDGSLLLNWGSLSPASISRISFSDALTLTDAEALRLFRDRTVVVAATYTGGVDVKVTPLALRTPASYAHIYALHTLTTGRYIDALPGWVPFLFALLLIGLLSRQIAQLHPALLIAAAVGLVALFFAGAAALLVFGRIVLGPTLPAAATFLFLTGYGIEQWWANLTARRRAEAFLERFVGAKLRRRRLGLEGAPDQVHAEALDLTLLSASLTNYSEVTRAMVASQAVDVIRAFHRVAADAVDAQAGTLDRMTGDGFIAYWGYPKGTQDQALRAVSTALDLGSRLKSLNNDLEMRGIDRLRVRIGIASGEAVLADVGVRDLPEFTVVGALTRLADRLRDEAPADGIQICATTRERAGPGVGVPSYEQESVYVDGYLSPQRVYLLERAYRAWTRRDHGKRTGDDADGDDTVDADTPQASGGSTA